MNKGIDPPIKLKSFDFLDKFVHQMVNPYIRARIDWLDLPDKDSQKQKRIEKKLEKNDNNVRKEAK